MKYIFVLFVLLIAAAIVWPYSTIYRLGNALAANDEQAIMQFVDLESVRARYKQSVEQQTQMLKQLNLGHQNLGSSLSNFLGNSVQTLSNTAVDSVVTAQWVRATLRPPHQDPETYTSLLSFVSFGFYESPTLFLVRLGRLGENPIHFHMKLDNWNWKVTAIYKCSYL